MKQVFHYIIILSFIFSGTLGYAQEGKVKVAGEKFEEFAYVNARDLYSRVANRGFTSPEVFSKLGDSYYFTADYADAVQWYEKLVTTGEEVSPEYYFRYAQSLKSIKKYDKADKMMAVFVQMSGTDTRGEMFEKERDYLKEIEAQSGRYAIEQVNFNTELQDFSPSFLGERVVISSNRKSSTGDYIHDWNNQPFLDLYVVDNAKSDNPSIEKFSKNINTPYHESSSVFTESGDEMYFTRNNYSKKTKLKRDEAGTTKLKLYHSYKRGGVWSIPEELPFNSDEYSTAHPALSPDGTILYFASDMPGTKGLSDIWMSTINEDGTYGTPINLGSEINTEGRETFPFVSSDNKLFYATDGHVGLGGLDVFVTQLSDDGKVGASYNVGKPVNSSADDFGLILSESRGTGYFSSNRASGLGNDDIYSFTRDRKILTNCAQNIVGTTRDVKTDEILPQTTVTLRDKVNQVVATVTSDDLGKFTFSDVNCSETYVVRGAKDTYEPHEVILTTSSDVGGIINRDVYLKPGAQLVIGGDLTNILELNPIYFDFDKSNIRPDAALELEKVIAVMQQYPTLKIDVRSHTDSRAPDAYNMKLSQRRNVSTIRYIVQQGGIDASRLTGRGYGETQLTNACANGIECSEEEHQLNRRSEFIIMAK
ncbi:flagellar motor protein MotB [Dokdonia sp. Dokd-P16]|uniref:OmpA family protein n=1 Tax=Dokdonia sp. Dokd-P16 TaxID=2173169 RepID=UPI000D549424|nr:OmpA family protein [Dokdonia sp. Dokd-P16]AWH74107.1 flagellar motor protein MotB [Dokdonia sp. Dokd-P16]